MPRLSRKPALTIADQLNLLASRGLPLPPENAQWMYRLLADQPIRRSLARSFGYPNPAFAESVFHSLTVLRNVCAHHARLWHRTSIQIAPRVLNRLKTDPDKAIYQATPWARLVVLRSASDG
ncbi:MAG: Abi family protein [Propionibacteriaceae bacterium]|nr:Abi family protein [Propionibacteriaceae bacterium]